MSQILAERPAAPVAAPPGVTFGPDDEGMYTGPTTELARLPLGVGTGWSAKVGASMWIDALLYESQSITPAEARQLALSLLQAADFVEGAPAVTS